MIMWEFNQPISWPKMVSFIPKKKVGKLSLKKCLSGKIRLGIWDWYVDTAIFKIDNQQGSTVKKFF